MKAKQIVTSIGALIGVYGIASSVLYFNGYNIRLLLWVDQWGMTAGWIIRIVLIVAGAGLYIYGRKSA